MAASADEHMAFRFAVTMFAKTPQQPCRGVLAVVCRSHRRARTEPSGRWPQPSWSEVRARRRVETDLILVGWTFLSHGHLLVGAARCPNLNAGVKTSVFCGQPRRSGGEPGASDLSQQECRTSDRTTGRDLRPVSSGSLRLSSPSSVVRRAGVQRRRRRVVCT
jgi:hypothetical protein